MGETVTCRVRVSTRWWLGWYLRGVAIMSYLSGADPDWTRVEAMVGRALVVRLERASFGVEA